MKIHNVAQLSDEWWELRRGVPTASEFRRIITAKEGKPSTGQAGYAAELFADLVCQNPKYFSGGGKPVNAHTERGRDLEEEAVQWYAFAHNVEIERVGFVTTNDGRFGCSPDAFIRIDGKRRKGLEVKCPEGKKVAKHALKGVLPLDYKAQCHGGLAVCEDEIDEWVLVEYCPDMKPFVVDLKPDAFTAALKVQLEAFDKLYTEVKAKLGVTKEPEVVDADAVAEWEKFFESEPDLATLNAELPKVSKIQMPTKRQVWEAIKIFAGRHGWAFKNTEDFKGFVVEEVSV